MHVLSLQYFGFDWESYLIEEGNLAPRPVCLSWSNANDEDLDQGLAAYYDGGAGREMIEFLEDESIVLIAHNMPFDAMLGVCHVPGVTTTLIQREIDAGRLRDTRVREQLIQIQLGAMTTNKDPRTGKVIGTSLAHLVDTYLGVDLSAEKTDPNAWRLRYSELEGVAISDYPDAAYSYSLLDSVYALRVFDAQSASEEITPFGALQDPDDPSYIRDERAQTRAAWDLHCMACNGPMLDQREVRIFTKHHIAGAELGFEAAAQGDVELVRWNPNKHPQEGPPKSPERGGWSENQKALREEVSRDLKAQGLDVPLTSSGQVSIATETLLLCTSPQVRAYATSKVHQKMVSTYVPVLKKVPADTRLTSSPNVLVNTGRTSWARPNLQQPPKAPGYRECFVPGTGNVFVSIDYDAIEMVALAQVFYERYGNTLLMDAINGGRDVHGVFGAQIINMDYQPFMDALGDPLSEEHDLVKTARQAAKPFNFGRAGGMGADTFLSTLDDGVKAALQSIEPGKELVQIVHRLLKLWDNTWNAHDFFRSVSKQVNDNNGKFVYRHRISGRVRGQVGYCDGCNLQFQGRVADGAKNAMRLLSDWMYAPHVSQGLDEAPVRCWAFIHDEFLLEGPAATVTYWATKATELLIQGMQPYCEDVKVSAQPAAMTRWFKGADTCWEDGQLIPWHRRFFKAEDPPEEHLLEELGLRAKPFYASKRLIEVQGPTTKLMCL